MEQFDAYMTDSASKNLQVEYDVAKQLSSKHIQIHLLCKSNVCEKFDATNISALAEIQNWIARKNWKKKDPSLKSFLHQKKSNVADVVLPALLKLVATEASSCTSSLSDEFSVILEEDGLKAISNFSHHVTLPFLNCVEWVDQNALCSVIPNLFQE